MGLYLIESSLNNIDSKEAFEQKTDELQKNVTSGELIEVQVAKDFSRAFFIIESGDQDQLTDDIKKADLTVDIVKEVRIVGQELDDVKKQKEKVNYLVEWNLPEDLTMDKYLERKKKNSVHYAEVPEVSFARTYVCEDMSKCLCFYDAPDEEAVKRAREAVKAPIDNMTQISAEKE